MRTLSRRPAIIPIPSARSPLAGPTEASRPDRRCGEPDGVGGSGWPPLPGQRRPAGGTRAVVCGPAQHVFVDRCADHRQRQESWGCLAPASSTPGASSPRLTCDLAGDRRPRCPGHRELAALHAGAAATAGVGRLEPGGPGGQPTEDRVRDRGHPRAAQPTDLHRRISRSAAGGGTARGRRPEAHTCRSPNATPIACWS